MRFARRDVFGLDGCAGLALAGAGRVGCGACVAVGAMTGAVRLPMCAGGDVEHRHGRGCLPLLVRAMPPAPVGWRYGFGTDGGSWSIWLERVGGAGARWHLIGLPPGNSAGHLAGLVEAYAAGYRGGLDNGPLL